MKRVIKSNKTFNEYLLDTYGITSDDMTDEDYDTYYDEYKKQCSVECADLPNGYLKTNRFNSRINDNNVLEAIEIAISQKFDQWSKTMDRQFYLTSGTGWNGIVVQYPEGYYIQVDVTRGRFQAFVEGDHIIRKPLKLSDPIGKFWISGDGGHVEYISRNHI